MAALQPSPTSAAVVPSNNRLPDVVRDYAIALVRELYADFGPTFAAEKLAERHDLKVSRETLRGWKRQAGSWVATAERKRHPQPRARREPIGWPGRIEQT